MVLPPSPHGRPEVGRPGVGGRPCLRAASGGLLLPIATRRARSARRPARPARSLDAAMPGRIGSDDSVRLNPRSIKKAVERRPGHPRRPDGRLATMPTSQ
eukprot:COSAG01_NODE_3120_length_6556_cov_11.331578_4_plen_99_part_01